MDDFSLLGLSDAIASALASFGFAAPTPVQKTAIPLVLAGRDLYMESETGTGKTFAYLAPALELIVHPERPRPGSQSALPEARLPQPEPKVIPRRAEGPGLLVAAPTQELAVQIGRECEKLIAASGFSLEVAVLLGGSPLSRQETALKRRPAIVIGTLGRLADLAKSTMLRLRGLSVIVFDEADRMLAPETEDEMLRLLESAPRDCTRLLVSATLPKRIRAASAPFMKDPVFIDVQGRPVLAGDIEHWCLYCDSRKRVEFLRRFDAAVKPARCLVFISQAARVAETAEKLVAHDLPVGAISARMDKEERRVALERFARGETRYLVTSDLAARGLDISGISHILSLDLPEDTTIYTHRAGRTGRAGAKGVSVILVDKVELERASKMAVKGGFVFRCKMLAQGSVLEPTTAEFFDMVESAWKEKTAFRATRKAGEGERSPYPAGRAPYSAERKPYTDARAPYPTGRAPYSAERKPYTDTRAPYPAGGGPYSAERKPYTDARSPNPTGHAPYSSERKPYTDARAPKPTGGAPYSAELKPYNSGRVSFSSEKSPYPAGRAPYPTGHSPYPAGRERRDTPTDRPAPDSPWRKPAPPGDPRPGSDSRRWPGGGVNRGSGGRRDER